MISKFILLLQKCVYPYNYMDDWEKFIEILFLKKKVFTVTKTWKTLLMQIMHPQKEFVKILNKKCRGLLLIICSNRYIIVGLCI